MKKPIVKSKSIKPVKKENPEHERPASKTSLFKAVRSVLQQAKANAYRTINYTMVIAYWNIGKLIVENEQQGNVKAKYGEATLQYLSDKLTRDFGTGYSMQSLANMRQFYLTFPILSTLWRESGIVEMSEKIRVSGATKKKQLTLYSDHNDEIRILSTAWRELTWSHYKALMRVEKPEARMYYIRECVAQNWSVRALERQIGTFYYERILSSKKRSAVKKEGIENTKGLAPSVIDFIKDPYVLEFLEVKPNAHILENDLEQSLLSNIQQFILELGKGFAFVGRQQHIDAEIEHYFIDLVFYNYILKCFVLLDLKVGKLTHQDVGQMDMYVRMYEEKYKQAGDNPPIGIILCSEQNESVIKYSVLKESKQLFSSRYKLFLPSEKELKEELERERALIEQQIKQTNIKKKKV